MRYFASTEVHFKLGNIADIFTSPLTMLLSARHLILFATNVGTGQDNLFFICGIFENLFLRRLDEFLLNETTNGL